MTACTKCALYRQVILQLQKWCNQRGIMKTCTDGGSFQSNGRVEGEISTVRRMIRTALRSSGLEDAYWPLAARHMVERRLRRSLQELGHRTERLLPFASEALARMKSWDDRYADWKVQILGPDVTMSASSPGYYVRDDEGRYFHSSDVIQAGDPPPEAAFFFPPKRTFLLQKSWSLFLYRPAS